MSIRNVKCGVSSCDAARVSRTGALRSQWCPAARLPTTVVTHSNWTRPDNTSRQLTASAAAAAGISPVAPPPVAFRNAVNAGIKKASLPVGKLFVLGILAGAYIGLGALLMMMVGGRCTGIGATDPGLKGIISGLFGLPCGLLMVIISGAELFTGNTALVTAAALEGEVDFGGLAKSWIVSYAGNLVGSVMLAAMAVYAGLFTGGQPAVPMSVAKTSLGFGPALVKGILCNWLVCMAIYLANATDTLSGKAAAVMFPIPAFVAIGLEHSVANMFIIPAGIMAGSGVSWGDFFMKNLIPVTIGNTIAGAVFVAWLLWLAYKK